MSDWPALWISANKHPEIVSVKFMEMLKPASASHKKRWLASSSYQRILDNFSGDQKWSPAWRERAKRAGGLRRWIGGVMALCAIACVELLLQFKAWFIQRYFIRF